MTASTLEAVRTVSAALGLIAGGWVLAGPLVRRLGRRHPHGKGGTR